MPGDVDGDEGGKLVEKREGEDGGGSGVEDWC